jgi:hypothetical protein
VRGSREVTTHGDDSRPQAQSTGGRALCECVSRGGVSDARPLARCAPNAPPSSSVPAAALVLVRTLGALVGRCERPMLKAGERGLVMAIACASAWSFWYLRARTSSAAVVSESARMHRGRACAV